MEVMGGALCVFAGGQEIDGAFVLVIVALDTSMMQLDKGTRVMQGAGRMRR